MLDFIYYTKQGLVNLTLIGGIFIVAYFFGLLFFRNTKSFRLVQSKITQYYREFSLVVAGIAMSGSLFYSDIAGYTPCKLCWFQRILMYPLVIVFGVFLWKKVKNLNELPIIMASIGGLIAAYHYAMQVTDMVGLKGLIPEPCSVVGYSPSCSEVFDLSYGYITIPMMALTAFVMILIFNFTASRNTK